MLAILSKNTPENDLDEYYTFFNVCICRIFYRHEEAQTQRRGESHEFFHFFSCLSLCVKVESGYQK